MTTGPEQPGPQGEPRTPSSPPSMSAPPVTESVPAGAPKGLDGPVGPLTHKTPWTAYIKPILWTLVAIYVIAFVFLNRDSVDINFIVLNASVPMIFVLVGMTLIGGVLCAGVMVVTRRRSTKKAELAALKAATKPGEK